MWRWWGDSGSCFFSKEIDRIVFVFWIFGLKRCFNLFCLILANKLIFWHTEQTVVCRHHPLLYWWRRGRGKPCHFLLLLFWPFHAPKWIISGWWSFENKKCTAVGFCEVTFNDNHTFTGIKSCRVFRPQTNCTTWKQTLLFRWFHCLGTYEVEVWW